MSATPGWREKTWPCGNDRSFFLLLLKASSELIERKAVAAACWDSCVVGRGGIRCIVVSELGFRIGLVKAFWEEVVSGGNLKEGKTCIGEYNVAA